MLTELQRRRRRIRELPSFSPALPASSFFERFPPLSSGAASSALLRILRAWHVLIGLPLGRPSCGPHGVRCPGWCSRLRSALAGGSRTPGHLPKRLWSASRGRSGAGARARTLEARFASGGIFAWERARGSSAHDLFVHAHRHARSAPLCSGGAARSKPWPRAEPQTTRTRAGSGAGPRLGMAG